MKFDKHELVAGIPMPLVRSLMQFFEDGYHEEWIIDWVQQKAGVVLTFEALQAALVARGLLVASANGDKGESLEGERQLTPAGFSLRYAQFNPRLTPKTAARLLDKVLARCQATLRDDNPAVVGRIETLFLFGSYAIGGQADYGDIDLVFDYTQTFEGKAQRDLVLKQPGASRYGIWIHTGLLMGRYIQGRDSYLNFCSAENYQRLDQKRPEHDRLIFSAVDGGRLDVDVPKTLKSPASQALYRLGYWDGKDGYPPSREQKPYQRGWEDGKAAQVVTKPRRVVQPKDFHVLLFSADGVLPSLPLPFTEKQRWEISHFGTLVSGELTLAETLTNLPNTLKGMGLTPVACELVESAYSQELHAHHDQEAYYDTTLPIEAHLKGKMDHSNLAQPIRVYRKGNDFLKGLKQFWEAQWQATAKAGKERELYWHAQYDTPEFEEAHWDESYVATKAVVLGAKQYKAASFSEKLFNTRLYVSLFTKAIA